MDDLIDLAFFTDSDLLTYLLLEDPESLAGASEEISSPLQDTYVTIVQSLDTLSDWLGVDVGVDSAYSPRTWFGFDQIEDALTFNL